MVSKFQSVVHFKLAGLASSTADFASVTSFLPFSAVVHLTLAGLASSTTDFANFSMAEIASPQLKSATSTTDFANFSTAEIAYPQLESLIKPDKSWNADHENSVHAPSDLVTKSTAKYK
ncbi:hypothetical protein F511_21985 [Dorcoceras hygrometricum]|uniref:Uncharacterized protein n=1 Tax=Dorcoceras hygrometricum TaxID=472368 RepID=A0A2Z7CCE2_9LAMI|nr:hypothetical protein F511_21983 [Dorcoceras hygrometricum]KZV43393.1 hypothetical protein F511_21985 [Dorcoceras hygrometricum]